MQNKVLRQLAQLRPHNLNVSVAGSGCVDLKSDSLV